MGKINTILWMIVIVWAGLSLLQMSEDVYGNNLAEKLEANSQNEDFIFNGGMTLYSASVITPTIPISAFPSPIEETYGAYCKLFLPDGYITIAGLEWLPFLIMILISMSIVVFFTKRKRQQKGDSTSPLWAFPIIFLLVLLLYPIWNALHIIMFEHFYALAISGTTEQAHAFYVGLAQSLEALSPLIIIIVLISMTKLGTLGAKFKKW